MTIHPHAAECPRRQDAPDGRAEQARHLFALSLGIAIALAGCERGPQYWADCTNSHNGERVQVIDGFAAAPQVRDKNGNEFQIDAGTPEWRCRRTAPNGGEQ